MGLLSVPHHEQEGDTFLEKTSTAVERGERGQGGGKRKTAGGTFSSRLDAKGIYLNQKFGGERNGKESRRPAEAKKPPASRKRKKNIKQAKAAQSGS